MSRSPASIGTLALVFLAAPLAGAGAQSLTTLYSFKPASTDAAGPFAPLVSVGGRLFGTTTYGGANTNSGTVFAIDPATNKETVLHSFGAGPDGVNPALSAGLVNIGGLLYGTTSYGGGTSCAFAGGAAGCGTIFSVNPATGAVSTVYSFAATGDAALPQGSLTVLNGILYGTTEYGGSANLGAIFAFNPATGSETVLYSFSSMAGSCLPLGCAPTAGLSTDGTTLYGASAQVFSFNPGTNTVTPLYTLPTTASGVPPRLFSAPLAVGGTLYGTTQNGGYGAGSVYAVNVAAGTGKALYAFKPKGNKTDATLPDGGLIDVGGTLYGAAVAGGAHKAGAIYSINPATGAESVLFNFSKTSSGASPGAALADVGGTLYGTTSGYYVVSPTSHPRNSTGTVFAFTP